MLLFKHSFSFSVCLVIFFLKARYDVLGKRSSHNLAFGAIVGRSQSPSEPTPLASISQMHLSFPPTQVEQDSQSPWSWVFPFLQID